MEDRGAIQIRGRGGGAVGSASLLLLVTLVVSHSAGAVQPVIGDLRHAAGSDRHWASVLARAVRCVVSPAPTLRRAPQTLPAVPGPHDHAAPTTPRLIAHGDLVPVRAALLDLPPPRA